MVGHLPGRDSHPLDYATLPGRNTEYVAQLLQRKIIANQVRFCLSFSFWRHYHVALKTKVTGVTNLRHAVSHREDALTFERSNVGFRLSELAVP